MAATPLPIDLMACTSTPRFRWMHRVDTLAGPSNQVCEGPLPPSVEGAVANLIRMAKDLQRENAELWERVEALSKQTVVKATNRAK